MYAGSLDALRTKLLASGSLNTSVKGQWFVDIAAENHTFPYGLLVMNAGSTENETKGMDLVEMDWAIQVIGKAQTANALLGEAIRVALHNVALTTSYNWNVYRCQHITPLHNVDIEAGQAVWFDGGVYRVKLSA